MEHPTSLHIHGVPKVSFPQSDGQDLCVSKLLASALYALGFHKEASKIDSFGISDLQGGAVDPIGKVSGFANKGVLLSWIVRKSQRISIGKQIWETELFSWELKIRQMKLLACNYSPWWLHLRRK